MFVDKQNHPPEKRLSLHYNPEPPNEDSGRKKYSDNTWFCCPIKMESFGKCCDLTWKLIKYKLSVLHDLNDFQLEGKGPLQNNFLMKLPRDPAPIAFAFFLCEFWMKTLKLTTWTEIVFLRPILQTLGWEIILGWLDILEIAFNKEKGITILLRLFAHYLKHFEGSLNIDIWSSPVALNQFISRGVDPGKIYWIKDASCLNWCSPQYLRLTIFASLISQPQY